MEATVLSCCSSWIWSSMPTFIWNNKLEISLERVEWFCWFFALILYILLDIHWSYKIVLFQAGIVRHRLSARQIVRSFKLKKLENYMRYQIEFLLPLKLQNISYYFRLWSQNTFDQLVCRIFYFWLIWLVNLKTGDPLLHCTCFRWF